MANKKICVVGGGVVGLSVALYLAKESIKQETAVEIVIIAEYFLEQTTSHGSAGWWEPYKIDGTPDDVINVWGGSTFNFFEKLHEDPITKKSCGLQLLTAYKLFEKADEMIVPSWKNIVKNFKILNLDNLKNNKNMEFPRNRNFIGGYTFESYVADQSYYLNYLTVELKNLNVTFTTRKIDNIYDFIDEDYDAVVNCCGIQGSGISGDSNPCYPIRGQVLRIEAPLMKNIWFYGTSYVIPNIDTVVIGGTSQKGDWSTDVSLEDTGAILKGVREAFPSLADKTVVNSWAGLRPGRTPLRLDSETKNNTKTKKEMIIGHCYGHGGAGVTLSWGCAEELVLNHILPFLNKTSQ